MRKVALAAQVDWSRAIILELTDLVPVCSSHFLIGSGMGGRVSPFGTCTLIRHARRSRSPLARVALRFFPIRQLWLFPAFYRAVAPFDLAKLHARPMQRDHRRVCRARFHGSRPVLTGACSRFRRDDSRAVPEGDWDRLGTVGHFATPGCGHTSARSRGHHPCRSGERREVPSWPSAMWRGGNAVPSLSHRVRQDRRGRGGCTPPPKRPASSRPRAWDVRGDDRVARGFVPAWSGRSLCRYCLDAHRGEADPR